MNNLYVATEILIEFNIPAYYTYTYISNATKPILVLHFCPVRVRFHLYIVYFKN